VEGKELVPRVGGQGHSEQLLLVLSDYLQWAGKAHRKCWKAGSSLKGEPPGEPSPVS
jgi:hypothetical protein